MAAAPVPSSLTEHQARARLARATRAVLSADRRLTELTRRRVELSLALAEARHTYDAVRERDRGAVGP
jgi:hypothetical protein